MLNNLKNRLQSPTPTTYRRIGNGLLGASTFALGYGFVTGHQTICIIALSIGAIGKFLTEFAVQK